MIYQDILAGNFTPFALEAVLLHGLSVTLEKSITDTYLTTEKRLDPDDPIHASIYMAAKKLSAKVDLRSGERTRCN
ncbi:MAG: hypothetical protein ACE5DX_04775 [Candidatus Dojkabacteria bacterium]